jgi:16S rRNA (guanine966-N2)-methyltransferase
MAMRVIAGEMRGMTLRAPKGDQTRPTADRVKESLFAILTPYLDGAPVLDLFAGSGALAIEALSRGARAAVLVDRNPFAAECIRHNLRHTRLEHRAELLVQPVERALTYLHKQQKKFDLIFADPPYGKGILTQVTRLLLELNLLAPAGIIILEHGHKEDMTQTVENFACIRQKSYGDTTLTFLRM